MATFTALNGGSPPKASDGANGSTAPARRTGSEERQSSAAQAPTSTAAAETETPSRPSAPADGAPVAAGDANRSELDRDQHQHQHQHQQEAEADRGRERPRNNWQGASTPVDRQPPQSTSRPQFPDSSNKRKRSLSPVSSRQGPRDHFGRRGESEPRDGGARATSRDHTSASPPKHAPSSRDTELRRALDRRGDFERGGSRLHFALVGIKDDNWGPNYEQLNSAVPDSAISEVDPMGDLSNSDRHMDSHYDDNQSPEMDIDTPGASYRHGSFVPEQRRDGVVQSDPKKRKRNFSNRTKTGCLTCRRRKKKCDEAKPECTNCIKGGFVCAGYPPQQRGAWPKQESKPATATVQIESKDPTYVPPGAYGMPAAAREPYRGHSPSQSHSHSQSQSQRQGQSMSQSPSPISPSPSQPALIPQAKREPLPAYRGQALRIETPPQRPIVEEGRPTNMPNSSVSDAKRSAARFPGVSQSMLPTPTSAGTPKGKDFPGARVPPLHDLSRKAPEPTGVSQTHLLPHINIGLTVPSRSPPPAPAPTSGVQATAQMALSHTYSSASRPRREKDEMLAGNMFYPYDKELVLERQRCSTSVSRFNSAANPGNGVSPTEISRLFREILQPSEGVQLSQAHVSPVTHTGQLGAGVVVEAPFHSDYGYNIKIADNVIIGRNCSIHDAAEVTIGANTVLSPNVCIYTAELPLDPRRRNGARGLQSARAVHIEEDVWIGANVVILAGVRIGAGSTVGAGSVVTKDLPARTICHGQPATVKRLVPFA